MSVASFEALHARVSDALEDLDTVAWELDRLGTDPDRCEEVEGQCVSAQAWLTLAKASTAALLLCFPDEMHAHQRQVQALRPGTSIPSCEGHESNREPVASSPPTSLLD